MENVMKHVGRVMEMLRKSYFQFCGETEFLSHILAQLQARLLKFTTICIKSDIEDAICHVLKTPISLNINLPFCFSSPLLLFQRKKHII